MHIGLFNGSPRKKANTATLLNACLEGAQEAGATGEIINLYSLDAKGCISCFQCKRKGGKSYGHCAVKDGLTPILDGLDKFDVLVLGTPVYFGGETSMTRAFMERLLFPYLRYAEGYPTLFPRQIPTAMIYTMNVPADRMEALQYGVMINRAQSTMARCFGSCELLISNDTFQFDDYAKYDAPIWDPEYKAKVRAEVFPEDCRRARELGAALVKG
ncbi:flavodoxin family protein [Pseudodesulfovibrio sp.]|uniref:flavodoxin family protein n=1 Tax=unclassified Pseudodesulfovibrio TaxID=2661612 RepID=UPI003AFF9D3D